MKKKIITIYPFLILLFLQFTAIAQNQIIKGVVIDENGIPMPGVNVVVVNEQNRFIHGTITDFEGGYRIEVTDPKMKLKFSFIGYNSQEVSISNRTSINITLEEERTGIEEVVVTASELSSDAFTPVAVRDLSSSVEKFKMAEAGEISATSVEDAVQGRMSNVDIVSNSGEPGAGMSIRIRGTGSLNSSSEPLIVIDGIPYDTNVDDDFDFATANEEDYGALVDIAPEDIKSIEILKDAGATAVWGSRGANGVLIINTLRGVRGKTNITYNYKLSTRIEPDPIPMLNGSQFTGYIQEGIWNAIMTTGAMGSQENIAALRNAVDEIGFDPTSKYFDEYNQDTDWLGEITRNSWSQNHNLSFSGGGDKARYRYSVGYNDELGTTIGSDYTRLTTRLNLDYFFSDQLKLSTDFSFSDSKRSTSYQSNVRKVAQQKMPNMSPWLIDDATGEFTDIYFTPRTYWQGSGKTWYNPIAMVHDAQNDINSTSIRSVFRLNWNLTKSLVYQGVVSFNKSAKKNNKFLPQHVLGVAWVDSKSNQATDATSETFVLNTQNKMIYRPKINKNNELTLVGSVVTNERSNTSYQGSVSGLGSGYITDPSAEGKIVSIGSGNSMSRQIGVLINGHYKLLDKYILSGSVRADGNSKFGNAQRWGVFPTVSMAWRLSNENFIKAIDFIDDLKIRASYGQSGNPPSSSYAYYGQYQTGGQYMDWQAILPTSMQLENLKWENVVQSNIGIDFVSKRNILELNFDLYRKTTNDMLMKNGKIPGSSGFDNVDYMNYGTMENSGWEFSGVARLYKKGPWNVSVNMNLSRNNNKVLDLPENISFEKYSFSNGNYARRIALNNPLGSFYGYIYDGVYTDKSETVARGEDGNPVYDLSGNPVYMRSGNYTYQPGDAKYRDTNYDGEIDEYDIVYLGNAMPILTGGIGPSIKYGDFSLRMFFHFRLGQKVINKTRMETENMYNKSNQSTAILARWRKPGDETDMPRALYGTGYNWLGSDRYVEDGSFMRFKQLSLGYNLPKRLMKKMNIKDMKVFLTAYDLFTFTKYSGQDPEVGIGGKDPFSIGYDNSKTPRASKFTFGLNVRL